MLNTLSIIYLIFNIYTEADPREVARVRVKHALSTYGTCDNF